MDLNQSKLIKSEWESIEIPISQEEQRIIHLIKKGFHTPSILVNYNISLLSFLKMDETTIMHDYLYTKYFKDFVDKLVKEFKIDFKVEISKKGTIKTADKIRLQQNETLLNPKNIF